MGKGYEVTGLRYTDTRISGLWHWFELRNKMKLCKCAACYMIEGRLKMRGRPNIGYHKNYNKHGKVSYKSIWVRNDS